MAYHSKEAAITVIIIVVVGIIVGCTALTIAIDIELNLKHEVTIKEEPTKEKPVQKLPVILQKRIKHS